ncbi:FKBP-type peptidyl-prolyl cis-trans isomerase [Blastomonas sp.]|uniref:FKBP-type peptidyl-prolyl cis-trans isomerase n=1 Tax=Blastomonas sp. TaxID=1909299 RepID=UPI002605A8E9|nr:FKBP-type peptidyl-prolyl cis-trans isomerase [Blastomonas sp.]MDM7954919.1 FKBP-type peptidyl-prolyl cis-trans isomerase [Blastomonas sp.]
MSVTHVPIPPIAKGSLTKLWLGVAVAVLVAGGAAWAGLQGVPQSAAGFMASNADEPGVVTTESGLQIKEITKGTGPSPTDADVTLINYEGTLVDGTPFDANERVPMPVAGSIPGFSEALKRMQRGGKYQLWIPPELGYGPEEKTNPQTGEVVIPANSLLVFNVELVEFIPEVQLRAMQQQLQGQAGPGGPPPGVPGMPGN